MGGGPPARARRRRRVAAAAGRQRRHGFLDPRERHGGVTVVRSPAGPAQADADARQETSRPRFRQLLKRDRHAALLRGDPRPAAGDVEIETPLAPMGAEDRRQEAGVRADPACRHRPSPTACSTWCRRPRRPYRPLSRPGDASRQWSITSRRPPICRAAGDRGSIRCWPPPTPPSPRSTG